MPDKVKKPRRSKEQAKADRVYKHYKSIKRTHDKEFVPVVECDGCIHSTWPHWHGYNKLVTTDGDWLLLAREHKLSVREVKNIVTSRRNWDRDEAIKVQEEVARLRDA